ncbi:MAG: hypothetical protein NVSMB56_16980 [Pyrinomonadaceae bacterium]
MKLIKIFALALVLACVGGEIVFSASPNESNMGVSQRTAKELFRKDCARCHGVSGRGDTELGNSLGATNLTEAEWQKSVSNKRLTASLINGRGDMPGFNKKLSRTQITALVVYVRSLKGKSGAD